MNLKNRNFITLLDFSTEEITYLLELSKRLKKEKYAYTRTAKLRLSNLKIEELTQILRGKSKQIKH